MSHLFAFYLKNTLTDNNSIPTTASNSTRLNKAPSAVPSNSPPSPVISVMVSFNTGSNLAITAIAMNAIRYFLIVLSIFLSPRF